MRNRGPHPVGAIASLRPGATLGQAQAELALIGRRLAGQYPDTNKGRSFIAQQLRWHVGEVGSTLWLLLGAVTFVLLARAVSRGRELAMRAALERAAAGWRANV